VSLPDPEAAHEAYSRKLVELLNAVLAGDLVTRLRGDRTTPALAGRSPCDSRRGNRLGPLLCVF
jgi:hypothetical protein